MPTIVYKGANRISDDGLIGKSIDDLKKDDIIVDALNLDGNESIRVNGSSVQSGYVIKSGDAVEFYKSQGTKGNGPDEPDIEVEEEEGDDDEEEDDEDEDDDEKEGD
jgi:hypothetical protein